MDIVESIALLEAKKLYDTDKKKKNAIKKGNIITFKKAFYPQGKNIKQIHITGIRKNKKAGTFSLEGRTGDTPFFNSDKELFDLIDWDWMESAHKV